jgi:hypothetical protein
VRRTGIAKHATCHTLRHSFATYLLDDGYDIRTIQELLGHKDVRATMIYAHVLNRGGQGVRSPIDDLAGQGSLRIAIPRARDSVICRKPALMTYADCPDVRR